VANKSAPFTAADPSAVLGRRSRYTVKRTLLLPLIRAVTLQSFDNVLAARTKRELWRKPYPLLHTLERMQRVIGTHDPRVLDIPLQALIDARFVRGLEQAGTIDALYRSHGTSMNFGQPQIDIER
jgi:hypothetical protein